jgi:hypothetical protein
VRVVVLVMLAACYGAPDYTHTGFRCDDTHGCPAGQQCIASVCEGGGSGIDGSASTFDGVKCGVGGTCGAGEQCCADQVNPFRCIPATSSCLGLWATCDGVEDCATDQRCCSNGEATKCGASSCGQVACTDNSDCPSSQPTCCFIDPTVPWGRCNTAC